MRVIGERMIWGGAWTMSLLVRGGGVRVSPSQIRGERGGG